MRPVPKHPISPIFENTTSLQSYRCFPIGLVSNELRCRSDRCYLEASSDGQALAKLVIYRMTRKVRLILGSTGRLVLGT